jgi:hypothetical protein
MTFLATLSEAERDNDVVYSLATGLAPGAVVGSIACMIWRWRGLYVGGTPPKEIVVWVPGWLRVEQVLSQDELRLLRILSAEPEGLDKTALIDRLQAEGRIQREKGKHRYRRLGAQFVNGLEEKGLVTVGPRDGFDGRRQYVCATDEGLRAFRMFGPTLREPSGTMFVRGGRSAPAPGRL